MSEPLRLVQVGAGGMGRAWLRNLAANPDVRLVGLVDLDADAARRAADEEGFPGLAGGDVGRRAAARAPRPRPWSTSRSPSPTTP